MFVVKQYLKGLDQVRRPVKRLKVIREYLRDAAFMNKHLLDGGATTGHVEYQIMVLVHSLEKGLTHRNPRAFGAAKVSKLVGLLKSASPDVRQTTAFAMGVEVLEAWQKFQLQHGGGAPEAMELVNGFLELSPAVRAADRQRWAGSRDIVGSGAGGFADIPFDEFLNARYSTRRFSDTEITAETLVECVKLAQLSPSACNRQMIKFHVFDDPRRKELLYNTLHGTRGVDYETGRLGVVTYDSRSLEFYGERNQGYLNSGLFAMTLVYAMHWRGIGSCLLQFGNTFAEERDLARALGVPEYERIAVGIAFGSLAPDDLAPASVRRNVSEIVNF